MGRILMACGAVAGAFAVALAAVAAHAGPHTLDPAGREAVRGAVQIQGWHAIILVVTGLWVMRAPPLAHKLAGLAGAGYVAGMLFFCGAIYAHHFAGLATFSLAPVGGVLLMLAWLFLAASALAAGPSR